MRVIRSARWLVLALFMVVLAVPSFAGVLISVNFAPPVLPVYDQPPCPEPDLMWTPGFWSYGPDGYFWVPGAWVPAPYEGALWTPGYWGWADGLYVFHEGYWGPHVGYYGGVNYGFGYMGIGFVGGEWRHGFFAYNTAVMHVDGRYVHTTFEDRGIVERAYVDRNNRVAFSGGPGGIRHMPSPEERMAERDQHIAHTSFQQQHELSFRNDRGSYVKNNGGHPQNLVVSHPLGGESHAAPAGMHQERPDFHSGAPANQSGPHGFQNEPARPYQAPQQQSHPDYQQQRPAGQSQPAYQQQRPTTPSQPAAQPQRPAAQPQPAVQPQRPAAQPQSQPHTAPAARPAPAAAPKAAPSKDKDKK